MYLDWLVESRGWVHLGPNAAGATECRLPSGLVVVWIPSGPYWRGSRRDDVDAYADEWPRVKVELPAFWIGRTPVTWAEWDRWGAGRATRPRGSGDAHPVVNVDWHEARAFARWAGGRLPEDGEWEKAARGGGAREFPWGHVFDPARCNSAAAGRDGTSPVGSYPTGASPYGCLDMAGNVCEWCETPFEAGAVMDARRAPRVVRGGSYHDVARHLRCANRGRRAAHRRDLLTGFRIAV